MKLSQLMSELFLIENGKAERVTKEDPRIAGIKGTKFTDLSESEQQAVLQAMREYAKTVSPEAETYWNNFKLASTNSNVPNDWRYKFWKTFWNLYYKYVAPLFSKRPTKRERGTMKPIAK